MGLLMLAVVLLTRELFVSDLRSISMFVTEEKLGFAAFSSHMSTAQTGMKSDENTTSPSLLEQIRDLDNSQSWDTFCDIYSPMLYDFCRIRGLQPSEKHTNIRNANQTFISFQSKRTMNYFFKMRIT